MEGAAQTVLTNLGQLVGKEYEQLRGVGGKVAQLRYELATMNAILRMHSEAEDGAVDHFIREWMNQVRELAYDAEDCVDLYVFRVRTRPGEFFLVRLRRLLSTLSSRHRLADDIDALRARAVDISDRHARYGVSRDVLRRSPHLATVSGAAVSARALRPANDPDEIVGMEGQANDLAHRLNEVTGGDHKLKVLSIVGFGGLGKTTLAMEVCRRLETEFQRQAQVSVSQAFDGRKDMEGLLKRLLQQIVKPKSDSNIQGLQEEFSVAGIDDMKEEALLETLKNQLDGKRYLIVIDDVWTIAAWDAIQSKLPQNNCDSRVIVTTRMETVAKACGDPSVNGNDIYHIEPLNLEDSKNLFLNRAFGSKSSSYPKELKKQMDDILQKCRGLPLAIVSIASLLASYNLSESKEMWETIGRSIGSQMEIHPTLEGMRQILTLSYNHLPYHLKGCMMYFSIFPEDFEIEKDSLLYRWIAEGLIEEMRGLTLMEVAEGYYNELISRSMIEQVGDIASNGYVGEACHVHDMMLEIMVSKSLESNFVSLIGRLYDGVPYDRIRRLSVHGAGEKTMDLPSKKRAARHSKRNDMKGMNMQHVRSLSLFELETHKLLGRLDEFTLLRVLDLKGCKGIEDKHMEDICRMYLLKYLCLNGTNISVLPDNVGELEHLQTLDVSSTYLANLPKSVNKLVKLERLVFSHRTEWYIMWMPLEGLHKMKALRDVGLVVLKNDAQVAKDISELEQLQRLTIYVQCDGPNGEEALKMLAMSLSKTYALRYLNVGAMGDGTEDLNFLLEIPSPPRLLRFLRFAGGLRELPSWVGQLTYLLEFMMSWARLDKDKVFSVLCKLPNLKRVILERQSYIGEELVARSTFVFLELRSLQVSSDYECPKVFCFEKGSMAKLEKLSVNFSGWSEKRFVGVEHLTSLKEVQLTGKKSNPALSRALEELKKEKEGRLKSKQFKIAVKYE